MKKVVRQTNAWGIIKRVTFARSYFLLKGLQPGATSPGEITVNSGCTAFYTPFFCSRTAPPDVYQTKPNISIPETCFKEVKSRPGRMLDLNSIDEVKAGAGVFFYIFLLTVLWNLSAYQLQCQGIKDVS